MEPAYLEFSVTASLMIEPDGPFLLEGGTVQLKLFEKSGVLDEEGKPTLRGKKFNHVILNYQVGIPVEIVFPCFIALSSL